MEFKKEIVQNVSNEIKNLFSQNINSLVNNAVNETLEKEKEIFYKKLNVCQEEFPNPKEKGLFRFCGICSECDHNCGIPFGKNEISNANSRKCQRVESVKNIIKELKTDILLKDEYLLTCTLNPPNGPCLNRYAWIISNYGRVYVMSWGNMNRKLGIGCYGNDIGYVDSQTIPMRNTENVPLNQEYIKILSCLKLDIYKGNNDYGFNRQLVNQIMDIYKQHHPKATEIFTIEQKTLKLKDKENKIKKLEDNYLKKYEELSNKEDELIKKEIKLENDIKVHKEKIKHLFKRENTVKLKETINSCKNELLQSAFKLNDVISIIPWPEDDDYDLIKQNIDNVISIMNNLTQ